MTLEFNLFFIKKYIYVAYTLLKYVFSPQSKSFGLQLCVNPFIPEADGFEDSQVEKKEKGVFEAYTWVETLYIFFWFLSGILS